MSDIDVGRKAPQFTLEGTGGSWSLSDGAGGAVVLYFYPRDNTPGCTQEGEDFRDLYPEFKKAGAEILGISKDSLRSHENFAAKFNFPFPLLADTEAAACDAFGAVVEKSMYGRKYMGIDRSTFLFDAKGVLKQEWRKVSAKGHAAAVLEAVKAL